MKNDERQAVRDKFARMLGCADDESFLLMLWGINALQSGNPAGGAAVFPFGVPQGADSEDMGSALAIYPWELETLANELLASPKSIYRTLACNKWETAANVVNQLRRIDDLDFVDKKDSVNIFKELFRISGRQFDWQRGYLNVPQFYRNIFIYGQGECAEYFHRKYGIGINELTIVGFGLYAGFKQRPNFGADGDFGLLGVTADMRDKALNILAAPLGELQRRAKEERKGWDTMAYRPSVLRRFPCVRSGRRGWKLRSPLPDLILERITSGLFYDVIGGGGPVRDDYGHRFEEYTLRYLRAMTPTVKAEPESGYKADGNRQLTPDIIVSLESPEEVHLAIECKATRMSFGARYADEPEDERSYEDIVKGVFQLWRYFSHCRRGLTGRTLARDAVGLLLTLDSWMVMNSEIFDVIFARAHAMADKRDARIEAQDRRQIAFCSIPDFEIALTVGTAATFVDAVRMAAEPDRRGGYLGPVHQSLVGDDAEKRPYPFKDLSQMLPWWGQVGRALSSGVSDAAAKPSPFSQMSTTGRV